MDDEVVRVNNSSTLNAPRLNNQSVFSTVEFDLWANRERLIPAEKYLIENYLDKEGKTLEAGTGGGRILLALQQRGFSSLHGFDFVPEFIEHARLRDSSGSISFRVQDAMCLEYEDCSFDQAVYLQQVLSFLDDESSRMKALRESYRILKSGGLALFSFLCFDARRRSLIYKPYLGYLSLLRKLRGSRTSIQYLPWLKVGGKLSLASLADSRPYVYWYRFEEVCSLLRRVGFDIVAVGSTRQINGGRMILAPADLRAETIQGMLYVVAKK